MTLMEMLLVQLQNPVMNPLGAQRRGCNSGQGGFWREAREEGSRSKRMGRVSQGEGAAKEKAGGRAVRGSEHRVVGRVVGRGVGLATENLMSQMEELQLFLGG